MSSGHSALQQRSYLSNDSKLHDEYEECKQNEYEHVDDVSIFPSMRWVRQRHYSNENYSVKVLRCDDPEAAWYT